ncbi:MAG: UvrD-helicase domain-containing protein [Planctomycetota bacterium]|nr:UvrD-helicase domain-containing protein [Planctomycetota bacterium]
MERLAKLNPPQREAVTTLSGPLLVLAGAGTGKTRVITFRIAELIRSGIQPDRILSVTFTNKAAREMRERTKALLGKGRKPKPMVSTFHSFCVGVLRQEITALGYPTGFAIYDRGDQESAARKALREIRIGEAALKPSDLLNSISRWKMAGIAPGQAHNHTETDQDFLAASAYRKYQKNLYSSGAVDFDDLLLLTNELFRKHPEVLEKHQRRFDHVQIDEYQDTNGSQFDLVASMVAGHGNLCVVGDDDQSIYGWRGADVEHILGFASHFPGAKIVRLENNYRCTPKILTLANRLVKHNRGRHEKTLVAHKKSEVPVRILKFEEETDEAEQLVREIKYTIDELGARPSEFAILFRTNEQPRVFETELRRQQLRYVVIGAQSFFDRREIRDSMAYLKSLAFPADEVSLLRIINTPARGIGTTSVAKLLKRAVAGGISLWDAVEPAVADGDLTLKTGQAVMQFRALLQRYAQRMTDSPRQMVQIAKELLKEVDYVDEIRKQYKEESQQESRIEILGSFIDSIGQYVEKDEEPTLQGYLESCALMGRDEEFGQNDQQDDNAIKLMTLHSAKGLEFPRVYLVGLEEGLLPHRRSVEANTESAIAEERRLCYVGITRAMDHLVLSRSESRMKWGKRKPSLPSRFLYEMQPE